MSVLKRDRQIFRIGTVRYAEALWRMRRHGPVIAHCTDSEDFPRDPL